MTVVSDAACPSGTTGRTNIMGTQNAGAESLDVFCPDGGRSDDFVQSIEINNCIRDGIDIFNDIAVYCASGDFYSLGSYDPACPNSYLEDGSNVNKVTSPSGIFTISGGVQAAEGRTVLGALSVGGPSSSGTVTVGSSSKPCLQAFNLTSNAIVTGFNITYNPASVNDSIYSLAFFYDCQKGR